MQTFNGLTTKGYASRSFYHLALLDFGAASLGTTQAIIDHRESVKPWLRA